MKTPPDLGADLFWESQVADQLGISRTRVRELRRSRLAPESDWQLRDNAVVLTASGLKKLELALAGSPAAISAPAVHPSPATSPRAPAAPPSSAAPTLPGPPPRRKFMVVAKPLHRVDAPQRKILLCAECPDATQPVPSYDLFGSRRATLGLGRERPIRVRDNQHFVPGMVLDAVDIGHGMWQYIGRLPRRLGKW